MLTITYNLNNNNLKNYSQQMRYNYQTILQSI